MNDINIDNLINNAYNTNKLENPENIKYELLIFTDGAHERVKGRSSFGIYVLSKNKENKLHEHNETKIIKKLKKDIILYKSNNGYIQHHSLFKNHLSEKCKHPNCNYFSIYTSHIDSVGEYCKLHKVDNMIMTMQFINYEPTNIRSEGLAILYALVYLKHICILNTAKKDLVSSINSFQINSDLKFKEYIVEGNNYKYYQIITDSDFWIKVITLWLNPWIKNNKILEKKNLDIIFYINLLMNELLNNGHVIHFKFIRGHADKNKSDKLFNIYQKGNIIADKLANIAKENINYDVKFSFT